VDAGRAEGGDVKRLVVAAALLAVLLAPVAAQAHPLGNFTINRFSRIEVSGPRVYVFYVLDMAEIPTFQAGKIDADAYARRIAANAQLTVGGRRVRLVPLKHALAHPMGAGGLHTTRLQIVLRGPLLKGPTAFSYRDTNYADRIGWKEILVGANTPSISHELSAYPKDMLQSPLDVTTAAGQLELTHGADVPPSLLTGKALEAPDRVADAGFSKLIVRSHLSLLVILVSLGAAMFWGAAHALSPGHGKTIVTAYLVGQRGTPWHAGLLGLIVTATHTAGVFALGFVTLLLSQFIVPDHLYPWLNLASGLLVVGIGASVLYARVRPRLAHRLAHARGHEHHHGRMHLHTPGHDHDHGHGHAPSGPGLRGLVAVGVSGGLLPCPSALVVLLAAISLHRVAFGLALIVAFSAGLALSITGVGLIAVLAKRVFGRLNFEGRAVSLLPAVSALVIVVAGVAMTLRAVPKLGS
jgi:ABC-type nickel/cobalt efflux system permease component RcnA